MLQMLKMALALFDQSVQCSLTYFKNILFNSIVLCTFLICTGVQKKNKHGTFNVFLNFMNKYKYISTVKNRELLNINQ